MKNYLSVYFSVTGSLILRVTNFTVMVAILTVKFHCVSCQLVCVLSDPCAAN